MLGQWLTITPQYETYRKDTTNVCYLHCYRKYFFQDFAYTLDALIFGTPCDGYIPAKQTRTLNLCQTTTINAT